MYTTSHNGLYRVATWSNEADFADPYVELWCLDEWTNGIEDGLIVSGDGQPPKIVLRFAWDD